MICELGYVLNTVMNALLDEFTKGNCKLSKSVRTSILNLGLSPNMATVSRAECEPFAFRERLGNALV